MLSYFWPSKGGKFLLDLFSHPRTDQEAAVKRYEELDLFAEGIEDYINFEGDRLFTYIEGTPRVLLVTGWESSAHRFQSIMQTLRNNDTGFLYFDLPAQGASGGKYNNAMKTSRIIEHFVLTHPSIDTIIGHSFGGAAAVLSVEEGRSTAEQISQIITVGSPTRYQSVVKPFFVFLDVPDNLQHRFMLELSNHIGRDFYQYDLTNLDISSNVNIHMFHDRDDTTIPAEDTLRLNGTFSLHISQGLGHRKIMYDPDVLNQITSILSK